MMRAVLSKAGGLFNRGLSTFNNRIFPKASRMIGDINRIGKGIGEASKAVRTIGSSVNSISGGRLDPFKDKANEVMSRIEDVGQEMTASRQPMLQALNTVRGKLNA